jgi:hypothetical protein
LPPKGVTLPGREKGEVGRAVAFIVETPTERPLAHVETIPQQDSALRALNKLARTFATQMEALKRYRTGGEQKVTVQHRSKGRCEGAPWSPCSVISRPSPPHNYLADARGDAINAMLGDAGYNFRLLLRGLNLLLFRILLALPPTVQIRTYHHQLTPRRHRGAKRRQGTRRENWGEWWR